MTGCDRFAVLGNGTFRLLVEVLTKTRDEFAVVGWWWSSCASCDRGVSIEVIDEMGGEVDRVLADSVQEC